MPFSPDEIAQLASIIDQRVEQRVAQELDAVMAEMENIRAGFAQNLTNIGNNQQVLYESITSGALNGVLNDTFIPMWQTLVVMMAEAVEAHMRRDMPEGAQDGNTEGTGDKVAKAPRSKAEAAAGG